jgi:hypothetical protein
MNHFKDPTRQAYFDAPAGTPTKDVFRGAVIKGYSASMREDGGVDVTRPETTAHGKVTESYNSDGQLQTRMGKAMIF